MNKQISYFYFILLIVITCCFSLSCSTHKPTGFTINYNKNIDTGIDSLINIDGYYLMQRECDSTFYSSFIFYPDGLFCIATGTDLSDVSQCFFSNEETTLCKNLSWGLYTIYNDTIKTQTLRQEGMAFSVIYRDYLIQKDKSLVNISDYVISGNTTIGYMKNYPSFMNNLCSSKSQFISVKKAKRSSSLCPYFNKKWF